MSFVAYFNCIDVYVQSCTALVQSLCSQQQQAAVTTKHLRLYEQRSLNSCSDLVPIDMAAKVGPYLFAEQMDNEVMR